jgi:hypothetical protein
MDKSTFTLTGATAEIRWGYHPAAQLSSWSMTTAGAVTAKVESVDAFRATQAPLTFVVPRPTQPWVWKVNSLQITGTTLTASLVLE